MSDLEKIMAAESRLAEVLGQHIPDDIEKSLHDYLHMTDKPLRCDIGFIKRLTDKGRDASLSLNIRQLENLHSINLLGARMAESKIQDDASGGNLALGYTFFKKAAELSGLLHKKIGNGWQDRMIDANFSAAFFANYLDIDLSLDCFADITKSYRTMISRKKSLSLEQKKRYYEAELNKSVLIDNFRNDAGYSFGYAGDGARLIFEHTKDIAWGERAYMLYMKCASMTRSFDFRHSAYTYGFAGDSAKLMFSITKDIKWAKRWYTSNNRCARSTNKYNPRHSAYTYGFAADAARDIFEKTRDVAWARKSYEARLSGARLSARFNKKHAAYNFSFAGDSAKDIFSATGKKDIVWAKKSYIYRLRAARIFEEFDIKSAGFCYLYTGKAAYEIFSLTKNSIWKKKMENMYMRSIEHFKKGKNMNQFYLAQDELIEKLNAL